MAIEKTDQATDMQNVPSRSAKAAAALLSGMLLLGCASTTGCADGGSSGSGGESVLDVQPYDGAIAGGASDPGFWQTPTVEGTGIRTVSVPAGDVAALRQAFADAEPGDRILLQGGVYRMDRGNLGLRSSGTRDHWIAVEGAGGRRPVIDMQGNGEVLLAGSHILFEGIEVINGGGNNLHIAPGRQTIRNIIVRGCRIRALRSGPGAAIKVNRNNAENAAVERVYIEHNDLSEAINNAVVDVVGLKIGVARGNHIHSNARGSHGMFFKGGSTDILVEGNLIRNIRGNAALTVGGNTGEAVYKPHLREWETVRQTVRNNLITDCDNSAIEIRGAKDARIYHNTIVTQTGFAIFRFGIGWNTTWDGGSRDIDIVNNLVIATGGTPQYARNDTTIRNVRFGPQLWGGALRNSPARNGLPVFPRSSDVVERDPGQVLADPRFARLTGFEEAVRRFRPTGQSPARGRGEPNEVSTRGLTGTRRNGSAPTLGAIE